MPISLKNMRGCASPASTAICSSTTGTPGRHRRLNSYLHDQFETHVAAPCISELPITPRSLYKKHFSDAGDATRRRSSAEIREYLSRRPRSPPPGSSSRFLLSEKATSSFREDPWVRRSEDVGPATDAKEKYGYAVVGRRGDLVRSAPVCRLESDKSGALLPGSALVKPGFKGSTLAAAAAVDHERNLRLGLSERVGAVKSSSEHQVVVLRVSLHCKGCVAKLRKHLSKMEGVTSFSIDLETKRVTVIGSVSPLDVLTSISRVKNAQFWPSPATSSSSFSSSSSRSGFNSMSLNVKYFLSI
ncbi:hypothetical protein V2J09_018161 [Rumex salicifolius]